MSGANVQYLIYIRNYFRDVQRDVNKQVRERTDSPRCVLVGKATNHFIERIIERVETKHHLKLIKGIQSYVSKNQIKLLNTAMGEDVVIIGLGYAVRVQVSLSCGSQLDQLHEAKIANFLTVHLAQRGS